MTKNVVEGLNPQQERAVYQMVHGPLIIKAGPGTGKTRTLVAKIGYLIDQGVNKDSILAFSYTTKASNEINNRLRELCDLELQIASTFHAFAYKILSEKEDVQLVKQNMKTQIIRKVLDNPRLDGATSSLSIKEAELVISKAKNSQECTNGEQELVTSYQAELKLIGKCDFDDLLMNLLNILKSDRDLVQELHEKYKYILVDEFQDTNRLQYEILKILVGREQNISVIGDPLQSIYSFRGAQSSIFEEFKKDYPNNKEVFLDTNYRSGQAIITIAHRLFPETGLLHSDSEENSKVEVIQTLNSYSASEWVINNIEDTIGGSDLNKAGERLAHEEERVDFKDFAVIFRNHSCANILVEKLRTSGLPFQVAGEGSIYERAEITFIISFVSCIYYKSSDRLINLLSQSFLNFSETLIARILYLIDPNITLNIDDLEKIVEQKNLSKTQTAKLNGFLIKFRKLDDFSTKENVFDLARRIVEEFEVDAKLSDVKKVDLYEFINNLVRFTKEVDSIKSFLKYVDDIAEQNYYDESLDKISLLTMHASKGLEFKYVYLIGFEDGVIPSKRASSELDIEEEKRLLFVALTRAKTNLFLIHAKERKEISTFYELIKGEPIIESLDSAIPKIIKKREINKAKKSQIGMGF